jgi:carboxymethylenebutenolidase
MEIRSEYVTLDVSDGTKMQCWVARPAKQGRYPGLLVFQEAFGVNAHIRDVTERFAREGYVAISPEVYHRTAPAGFAGPYDNFPALMPHIDALKREGIEADLRAAFDWLRAHIGPDGAVASIGFCMGGTLAVSAALFLPLACATSYYGATIPANRRGPGLIDRLKDLRAPVLLFWGGADQHVPPESIRAVVDALRAADKDYVNVEIAHADHGFFTDDRPSYSPRAAALAWPLTLAFLKQHTAAKTDSAPPS